MSKRAYYVGGSIAVLGLVLWLGPGFRSYYKTEQHRELLRRIDRHVGRAMEDRRGAKESSLPFPKLNDVDARLEILRAVHTALFNEFWYPPRVSAPKLRAVADRLDTTRGEDFGTLQGCLTILDLLEDACPTAKEYPWFAEIHTAQEAGNFPRLPQSKRP